MADEPLYGLLPSDSSRPLTFSDLLRPYKAGYSALSDLASRARSSNIDWNASPQATLPVNPANPNYSMLSRIASAATKLPIWNDLSVFGDVAQGKASMADPATQARLMGAAGTTTGLMGGDIPFDRGPLGLGRAIGTYSDQIHDVPDWRGMYVDRAQGEGTSNINVNPADEAYRQSFRDKGFALSDDPMSDADETRWHGVEAVREGLGLGPEQQQIGGSLPSFQTPMGHLPVHNWDQFTWDTFSGTGAGTRLPQANENLSAHANELLNLGDHELHPRLKQTWVEHQQQMGMLARMESLKAGRVKPANYTEATIVQSPSYRDFMHNYISENVRQGRNKLEEIQLEFYRRGTKPPDRWWVD